MSFWEMYIQVLLPIFKWIIRFVVVVVCMFHLSGYWVVEVSCIFCVLWPFDRSSSLVAQRLKHLPAMRETWVRSLGRKDPLKRKWQPTPVFLPGESHGWRSLVGYRPRVAKSRTRLSDFTFTFSLRLSLVGRFIISDSCHYLVLFSSVSYFFMIQSW